MSDFEQELKLGFLDEATQMLVEVEQCFLVLESNPSDFPTIEKIFRLAHNIKGSSRAVVFDSLGAFTHEFESFLLKCKSGEIAINAATVSLLLACTDHITVFIDQLKTDQSANIDGQALVERLLNFQNSTSEPAEEANSPLAGLPSADLFDDETEVSPAAIESSEPTDPFDSAQQISEIVNSGVDLTNAVVAPHVAISAPPKSPFASAPKVAAAPKAAAVADESIRVSLARLEKLINFVGEMVILQTVLREQSFTENPALVRKTIDQMGKVTKEIQELSMSLRMIPLKQTFQKMQRIVRDTSSVLNKKVNLILEGEDTEVDKTVLESLSDPLVHLIRNAVDHGIENPEARMAAGKSESGTVTLKAYHQSGQLVIDVIDNGGGIPADRLRQKALERGILKPGQVISDQAAVELIFHPGFSTKTEVTEVSGRGVGMDVVKTNIEQMQGRVLVETVLGAGSTFKILLPLTLAIIDGMVVVSGTQRFVIPRLHVHESVKLEAANLKNNTPMGETLFLRGENLPVVRLGHLLNRKSSERKSVEQIAIIVRSQGRPFATLVDDITGQQQVVIKKLGPELQNIKGFSGSAILGDGRPALILELIDLISAVSPKGRAS